MCVPGVCPLGGTLNGGPVSGGEVYFIGDIKIKEQRVASMMVTAVTAV